MTSSRGSLSSGGATPLTAYNNFDFAPGHYTDTGGSIETVTNQGTGPLDLAATGTARPTYAAGPPAQANFDASSDVLSTPLITMEGLIARINCPDMRNGPNDTTTSGDFPAWNSGTSYAQDVSTSFVVSTGDGNTYYRTAGGPSVAGVLPEADTPNWLLLNRSGGSLTGINRNLKKGSGYIVGNSGSKFEGASVGGTNKCSVVFMLDDLSGKDTAYGDGTGARAGELIMPAGLDGMSMQSLCIDPDDHDAIFVAMSGGGVYRITTSGANFTGTVTATQVLALGQSNGMAILGNSDPLGDGTYAILWGTSAATADIIKRYDSSWVFLGERDTNSGRDNCFWDDVTKTIFSIGTTGGGSVVSAYGTALARLPKEPNGAPQTFDSTFYTDPETRIGRAEGICLSWDRTYLIVTHNGTYHQSNGATPNQSCFITYTAVLGGIDNDAQVITSFIRGAVSSVVNTKCLFQHRDATSGGFGVWTDTTAGTPFRVYVKGSQLLSGPNTLTTDRIYCFEWNGITGDVKIWDDTNTLINTLHFDNLGELGVVPSATGNGRLPKGALSFGGSPQDSASRYSSLRLRKFREYIDVVLTDSERAAVFAEMAL